ncbi:MAG: GntR family transcriptional regulator [Bifidobacteriaceae bacterium]|nr:GntR family transcriptional regulator [Bifidobacteriaceae bacterium]
MILRVDPASDLPLGAQLKDQISLLIRSGELPSGARLPAIRHLATDLGLARGTVAKAYEQLAQDGLVKSGGRHGTVVGPVKTGRVSQGEATERLQDAAWRLTLLAHQLGVGQPGAQAALDAANDQLQRLGDP